MVPCSKCAVWSSTIFLLCYYKPNLGLPGFEIFAFNPFVAFFFTFDPWHWVKPTEQMMFAPFTFYYD